jgi:hypothetical protein
MFNDIGKLVARYLQAFAWMSVAWMIISPIFFDSFHLDLSVIFLFWAAAYLMQHDPTARKWTIGVCAFALALVVGMFIYAAVAGTEGMTVTIGRRIDNPSLGQVAVVSLIFAALAGLPLVLLLTPKARREFGQRSR